MVTKILVVEDDPTTLDMVTIMLQLRDYEIIVAKNGIEGIDKASAENPDLIVTDIVMPELNGIEMIKQLRSKSGRAGVPILVITGNDMENAKEAIRAGANRALAKPFSPDLLHVFIKDLLKKAPAP